MSGKSALHESNGQHAQKGFSLIELLVVIAIIAVLAAILFPVFATVRENVRQKSCMSQMQELHRALQLYKLDNNKYPATLYGYAELPGGAPYTGSGSPVPMGSIQNRALFKGQKYLKDPSLFQCPDNTVNNPTVTTTAVYPSAPGVTLSGTAPGYYYTADAYDTGPQVDANSNVVKNGGMPVQELHYSLSWTTATGPGDSLNQLKYPSPPEDKTVVTWCTYHAATNHATVIPVLLLSGTVKTAPVNQFVGKGPLNFTF